MSSASEHPLSADSEDIDHIDQVKRKLDAVAMRAAAAMQSAAITLSDTEIDELAAAIVRQVKLRGPFLSLSEFVNRRLDPSDTALSAKGALQAALDLKRERWFCST
jgi:hypothetical protein